MWAVKYADPFVEDFSDEQDYIDAAFAMIVLYNWGIWITAFHS